MLLEVKNLKIVLDHETIHSRLSFQLEEGEILTILGPNGSGKSVLLKALLGLLPYHGDITWHNKPRIGYLPQHLSQQAIKKMPLTVADFFKLKQNIFKKKEILQALDTVGLEASLYKKPANTLSGGQFQRMLLAWVLISKPGLLILDEPTSGIDIGGDQNIYTLLDTLRTQYPLTIVMVTHDIHVVYAHSDKVLCLKRKDRACFGKPNSILTPQKLEHIFGMKLKFYQH